MGLLISYSRKLRMCSVFVKAEIDDRRYVRVSENEAGCDLVELGIMISLEYSRQL